MAAGHDIPDFHVHSDSEPTETLLCGFSEFGLAGLTAVDYLTTQLDLEQVGHIAVEQLPAITPFENGTPRHHTRLFSRDGFDLTVLVGELFVPPFAAGPFAESILDWTASEGVSEVVLVSGVPIAHGPDDHRAFYIASPDYQAEHDLSSTDVSPMAGGFLDGVNGAITSRGIDSPLRTCVLTTPAHAQTPDVEAALRLLGAVETVYDFDIDTGPLEEFAAEISNHYEELAQRMEAQQEELGSPVDDRMFM